MVFCARSVYVVQENKCSVRRFSFCNNSIWTEHFKLCLVCMISGFDDCTLAKA